MSRRSTGAALSVSAFERSSKTNRHREAKRLLPHILPHGNLVARLALGPP
jgi:hypothetical protein